MAPRADEGGELISGINVTPLVDIVLVLLVVTMVTAGYMVSQSIPVELPRAATSETGRSPLAITLSADGTSYIDAQRVSDADLPGRIRSARASGADKAMIAADGSVPHRRVIRVVDTLRAAGITELAFDVQPEDVERR
jgi:biopolymer transport protein ExbD